MPYVTAKRDKNKITISFVRGEGRELESILEKDAKWKRDGENDWVTRYSTEGYQAAKRMCQQDEQIRFSKERPLDHYGQLMRIVKERDIRHFVHFTRVDNLKSILENGLLSVREMKKKGIAYVGNDESRLENRLDAICLSVSFPNYQMFYSYRKRSACDWIVIELSPRLVLKQKCAFVKKNAACSDMRADVENAEKRLSSPEAFESMFRGSQDTMRYDLPSNYSTDPQAEILVFDEIPIDAITGIVFDNSNVSMMYEEVIKGVGIRNVRVDQRYFSWRQDWIQWKREGDKNGYETDLPFA